MYAKLVGVFDGYSRQRFYSLSEPVRMGYSDVDKAFDVIEKAKEVDIIRFGHDSVFREDEDQYVRECKGILENGVSLVCINGPDKFKRPEKYMTAAMRYCGRKDGKDVPCYEKRPKKPTKSFEG